MSKAVRFFVIAFAMALIITLTISWFRIPITTAVLERVLEQRIGSNLLDTLDDGLHLVLCGAGSPMPDPKRSGPCVAVIAGDTLIIVDAGTGGARNLSTMSIPQGSIHALLLTHFHSDHIDGLGELALNRWVQNANPSPLPVIAPEGVEAIVDGFNLAYSADAHYRFAHHTDLVAPLSGAGMVARAFSVPEAGQQKVVLEHQGLTVTAFPVDHEPVSPAVGYRFDYKDRSLVISGDTAKTQSVIEASRNVDVLAHEALSARLVSLMQQAAARTNQPIVEKIALDIPDYHTTPREAAEVAAEAKARALLYYHIVPALPMPGMESIFVDGVDEIFQGRVEVGVDGTMVSLPANSTDIAWRKLM